MKKYYETFSLLFILSLCVISLTIVNADTSFHRNANCSEIGINDSPVANFSWSPEIPTPGQRVMFDASESYDPDGGSISSYFWDFNDGSFATGKTVNHTFNVSGHYDVKLYIIDDEEESGYCNKMVYVGYPPVAEFTFSPKYPELGENVLFDGSPSYDKDGGDILLYKWDFDNDGHYESSGKKIGKVYPHRGMYNVGLCVVDDEGQMNTTEKTISVGKPPVAEFEWSPIFPEPGQIVTFNASESYDPETDIRWYEWDWDDDGIFDEKNYYDPISTFAFQNQGPHSVTLRVTNIWGVYNTTKKIVYVGTNEEPPTVGIIYPVENDVVKENVSIIGNASDIEGFLVYVEVKIDNGEWIKTDGITSWSYQWDTTLFNEGDHIIYARSYDGKFYSSIKSVNVSVDNIPEGLVIENIKGGIGRVSAVIANNDIGPVYDVEWSITVQGNMLNDIYFDSGVISSLEGNGKEDVFTSGLIFGFGKIDVIVTVVAIDVPISTDNEDGFIFGPFIFL